MKLINSKRNTKGETLIETLVAIIILTVSAMLLAEVTTSSTRINLRVEEADEEYRDALETVEKRVSPVSGEITIQSGGSSYTYEVNYFGDMVGLTSYEAKEGGI